MVIIFLRSFVDALLLESTGGRDVNLATDDRLDAVTHRLPIELDGTEHVAVVGHGDRGLFQGVNALE
jgi:hypothetical protein